MSITTEQIITKATIRVEEIAITYRRKTANIVCIYAVMDELGQVVSQQMVVVPSTAAKSFLLNNMPAPIEIFNRVDQWLRGQIGGGTLVSNDDVTISV